MSREEICLIEVAEWFDYRNRCSTIEQVGNCTGTRRVFVPTQDLRSLYFQKVQDMFFFGGHKAQSLGEGKGWELYFPMGPS